MNGTINLGDYRTKDHKMESVEGRVVSVALTQARDAENDNIPRGQLRITIDALTASIAADFPLPSEQTTAILQEKLTGERVLYLRKYGVLESKRTQGDYCRVQRLKILSGSLAGETMSDISFY